MRIHTDTLTSTDIYAATRAAGMTGVSTEFTSHGSRKRDHAFNVTLTGNSPRTANSGRWGASDSLDKAATWDEWGMFLAALYAIDPNMDATYYADAADFHRKTGDRFLNLTAPYQHRTHNWTYDANIIGQACKSCEAVRIR